MVTPIIMAGRKADAASPGFTKTELIAPGEYGRWIAAVVNRFGDDEVARWKGEPPVAWSFDAWLSRQRAKAQLFRRCSSRIEPR